MPSEYETTRQGFLADLAERPGDVSTMLIFADHLEAGTREDVRLATTYRWLAGRGLHPLRRYDLGPGSPCGHRQHPWAWFKAGRRVAMAENMGRLKARAPHAVLPAVLYDAPAVIKGFRAPAYMGWTGFGRHEFAIEWAHRKLCALRDLVRVEGDLP